MKKHLLAYVGIALVLIGFVFCSLTVFGIRSLNAHDEWYVSHFFGPQHQPEITYEQLFAYTTNLTKLRGQAEIRFYCTLAVSCFVIGGVLLAWARDRRRLSAFTNQTPQPKVGVSGRGPMDSATNREPTLSATHRLRE